MVDRWNAMEGEREMIYNEINSDIHTQLLQLRSAYASLLNRFALKTINLSRISMDRETSPLSHVQSLVSIPSSIGGQQTYIN